MRCQLNGINITSPVGIDSLTLTKSRHRMLWGFFHRNMGAVAGLGNLLFTDPVAVGMLETAFRSVDAADLLFWLTGEGIDYRAAINMDTYSRSGEGVSVGLRDGSIADTIAARSSTVYNLPTTVGKTVGASALDNPTVFALPPYYAPPPVVPRNGSSGLPFVGVGDPSLPITLYTNTDTVAVSLRIEGRIEVKNVGTGTLTSYSVQVGSQVIGNVPVVAGNAVTLLVNQSVSVLAGATAMLTVNTNAGSLQLVYDASTTLSMTVLPTEITSTAFGMTITQALRGLLDNMGLTGVGLTGNALTDVGGNLLATATGLSGSSSGSLQLSLSDLLNNLCACHYLKIGLTSEGSLSVDYRNEAEPGTAPIAPNRLTSLTIRRAVELTYGSVQAGYDAPGDTTQKQSATHALRTLPTRATASRNELLIKPSWVSDAPRIEQARRGLLSQNAAKNADLFYLQRSSVDLSANGLRQRWAGWWLYTDALPEYHTLTLLSTYEAYLTLGGEVPYTGPDGQLTYGTLLDASFVPATNLLTLNLLVR